MKHLLIVYSTQTGRTRALALAADRGARSVSPETPVRTIAAGDASLDDLLASQVLLVCTPENFGYMSGSVKDFFDRTYYPAEGLTVGLPYAMAVSAGNDGTGAVRAVERIATGYGWRRVAEPLICRGEIDASMIDQAVELGKMLALGAEMGLF